MQIDFFEEFPSEETLSKAKLMNGEFLVYIASSTISDFHRHRDMLSRISSNAKAAYWPLLRRSYWVSPFSFPEELEGLYRDLENSSPMDVLIDLELPLLRPALFLKNVPHFLENKRLIRKILGLGHRFLAAVYPATGILSESILRALGIWHPQTESCVMYYTSMIQKPAIIRWMQSAIRRRALLGHRTVGLGCLAPGIFGTEPVITTEGLKRDMDFLTEAGVKRAILFRLGGLDSEFASILCGNKKIALPGSEEKQGICADWD